MEHQDKALDREQAVLRNLLDRYVEDRPEALFVHFWPDVQWSYRMTWEKVRQRAATLHAHGVRRGSHVLCFMGNGPDLLVTWFAINYLCAVYIPLNTASRGRPLEHILSDADAPLMVAEAGLLDRLADVAPGKLRKVLAVGAGEIPAHADIEILPLHEVDHVDPAIFALETPIEPWDTLAIMYTSGTTGNPKGVVTSYAQLYTMGPDAFEVAPDDRCLICGPIFHCGSTLYVYAQLARGLSIGMMREFKTREFWSAVRGTGSTYCLLLGVMASFLLKEPSQPDDRDHPLRRAFITPFGEDGPLFAERFGVEAWTIYNMTEIASPLHAGPLRGSAGLKGIAGRPRPWFDLRIVDANDIEVPEGATGELIIRSSRPWALMKGYHNAPAATVEAMRNGWFHTGDGFRRDAAGQFFFVDRLKDVIRRRGENISSFALEAEVTAHPDVRECAAVAVPSAFSEDEVLIVVTPVASRIIDAEALVAYLAAQLPKFMVPRYVRVMDDLPKTASGKIQKHILRTDGVTGDTFDREQVAART
ncbi:AMP-binding protein [Haematobacter genomosp. 1]|uniref:ATP-dependent acyl-CoA ligase n=1 Tax=Haematobacter genomosp. 1 TaxID=366618 RepID=A0A212AFU2_9RHOB|nr:AMP-binding protein [Haematobacter genomosp. 1]OWJ80283.1 ATP-dependent acyl-CoA ligase [Haematobacter genomosp. 1]